MSNKEDIMDNIQEVLENGSLSGYKIIREVRSNLESINNSTFYEALYDLLDNELVDVLGYDKESDYKLRLETLKNPKQKQSFKFDGVIFGLIKVNPPEEIRLLLNKLENTNFKETKLTRRKLQKSFEKKFREYEKQEDEYWNGMKKKLTSIPIEEAIKKLSDELYNDISNLRQNYIIKQIGMSRSVKRKTEVDENGNYFSKNYLEEKDFEKPIKKSSVEINRMFDGILFHINSIENDKFLKNAFSLALSDDKESMDYFQLFLKDNLGYMSKKKLAEILNVKQLEEDDPNVKNYMLHKKLDSIGN